MNVRLISASVLCLMLLGCGDTSTTATPDDGTVNGRTTEDAGGDGTNTTGGGNGASSERSAMLQGNTQLSVGAHSSTYSF